MRVIPCGYGNRQHAQVIPTLMTDPTSLLIDVRLSPRSAVPGWNRTSLQNKYGERFVWLGESLGNVNFEHPERGIEIADLDTGVNELLDLLWKGHIVLLLCGCGSMEPTKQHPHGCHRRIICEALVEVCSEVEIVLPEQIESRWLDLERARDEREALYMTLNGERSNVADYWLLPEAQQRKVRMEIGVRS